MKTNQFDFDEAEQTQNTEQREYRREFAKIQIQPKKGKEKAAAGQGVSYGPVVLTAITACPPFKNTRMKDHVGNPLPAHYLEFFDPETGDEYKLVLDSIAKKKYEDKKVVINKETGEPVYDGIKRNFPGGILYNIGEEIDEDELMDIIDRDSGYEDRFDWDPTEFNWPAIGGMYKLNPKFFGKCITIFRKAISMSFSGTLQVFEYKEVDTKEFPKYDEYLTRYDEFGNWVDSKPTGHKKSSQKGSDEPTDDMINMVEELILEQVPKADAIAELKGLAECSRKAAEKAYELAMLRLSEADTETETEPAANEDGPAEDPDDAWMTDKGVSEEQFKVMKEAYDAGNVKPLSIAKELRTKLKMDRSDASDLAKSFVAHMKVTQE